MLLDRKYQKVTRTEIKDDKSLETTKLQKRKEDKKEEEVS